MFWIFILAILAVAYIDNVLAFLKNVISFFSERPNLLCVFTTVILSVFLIVGFYFMISSSIDTDDGFQNEMVEKKIVKASDLSCMYEDDVDFDSIIVVPDGYNLVRIRANNAYYSGDSRVVEFDNGKKVVSNNEIWKRVYDGDVCSYIRKFNEQRCLIEDTVLPVAPEFVRFDLKKGTVSFN